MGRPASLMRVVSSNDLLRGGRGLQRSWNAFEFRNLIPKEAITIKLFVVADCSYLRRKLLTLTMIVKASMYKVALYKSLKLAVAMHTYLKGTDLRRMTHKKFTYMDDGWRRMLETWANADKDRF